MRFSQRIGKRPVNTIIQTEGMTDELRNSIWNVLALHIWERKGFIYSSSYGKAGDIYIFSKALWFSLLKRPIDTRPERPAEILKSIRHHFFNCDWYDVYDFLEFTLGLEKSASLNEQLNSILQRELAGYRFISGSFVPVTDQQEIKSIEQAMAAGPFAGVEAHLSSAIEHLSRKQNPDYRNSIKESISAVESLAKELTGNTKATLGQALSTLEKEGKIHPALKSSLTALYGYTSDEGGIRHAMLEEPELSASDAKFLLVACSAFINYMKEKV